MAANYPVTDPSRAALVRALQAKLQVDPTNQFAAAQLARLSQPDVPQPQDVVNPNTPKAPPPNWQQLADKFGYAAPAGTGIGGEGLAGVNILKDLVDVVGNVEQAGPSVSPEFSMRTGRRMPEVQPIDPHQPLVPLPQPGAISGFVEGLPAMLGRQDELDLGPALGQAVERGVHGAASLTSPSGLGTVAGIMTPGPLQPYVADMIKADILKSVMDIGGEFVGSGDVTELAGRTGELAGNFAPLIPSVKGAPHGKTPKAGLSIDPFPDAPAEAFATGKRPEQIKTSRDRVGHMVASVVDDMFGGDLNADPVAVHEAAVREFGPDAYVVTTGQKQKRVTPEEGMALARRSRAKIQSFGGNPQSRETVDSYYNNEVGKQTQPWYHRGLDGLKKKWAAQLGDEGAAKAIDDGMRWENLYSANRGVDEAMDMGVRGMLAERGFFDFPAPMDINVKEGQTPEHSEGLFQTRAGGMVGGPKLGPFGESKRAGVDPTKQPTETVPDRIMHGVYLGDSTMNPRSGTRQYVDARNRIGANRMYREGQMEAGRPPELQQRQARDWGGYQDIVKKNPEAGAVSFAERYSKVVDYYGGPDAVFRGDQAAFDSSPYMAEVRAGHADILPKNFDLEHAGDTSFDFGANTKETLRPAVKLKDGQVVVGEDGDTHADVFKLAKSDYPYASNEHEAGFFDGKRFLSREESESYYQPARAGLGIEHVDSKRAAKAARDTERPEIGGFTFDKDGNSPTTGYSYSPYKDREFVKNGALSSADILDYQQRNADLLSREGHNLGGWKDGDGRYLDVSVHNEDLGTALAQAKAADQKGIFDHANFKTIPLSGAGTVVKFKDGTYAISDFVPEEGRNLPTHLSVVEKSGRPIEDVVDTGWIRNGELELDSGGGTVGRGVVKGMPERRPDYVPYAQRKGPNVGGMVAYHGSPYDFTEFDPSKIGSGEGAQAYGYGIYLAQNPHVANDYAKKLAKTNVTIVGPDGKSVDPTPGSAEAWAAREVQDYAHMGDRDPLGSAIYSIRNQVEADRAEARKDYNSSLRYGRNLGMLSALKSWRDGGFRVETNKQSQNVYHFDVPDEHLVDFLDLDKPLSEQPRMMDRLSLDDDGGELTGGEYYNLLAQSEGAKRASELLESVGIKGNKYLDHNSRYASQPGNEMVIVNGRPMDTGQHPIPGEALFADLFRRAGGNLKKAREAFEQHVDDVANPEHFSYGSDSQKTLDAARAVFDEASLPDSVAEIRGGDRFGTRNLVLFPNYSRTVKMVAKGGPVSAFTPKPRVGLGVKHVDTPEGDAVEGRIGSLNLRRIGLVDEQKQFIRDRAAELEAAKKTFTFEELQQKAEDMGLTLNKAIERAEFFKQNRGAIVAASDVATTAAAERHRAFQSWKDVQAKGTPAEIESAAIALDRATERAMNAAVAAAEIASEAGRNLVSAKIVGRNMPLVNYKKALTELVKRLNERYQGNLPKPVNEMLRDIDMEDPASIARFIASQAPTVAKWGDKFYEFWINGLLSNPTTHFRNMVGNSLALGLSPIEKAIAGVAGLAPGGKTRLGEAPAGIYGMAVGMRGAWKSLAEGLTRDTLDTTKLDVDHDVLARAPKIAGVKGKVIRTPTRFLSAADNAVKALVVSKSLHEQAYRMALEEGLKGGGAIERARQIVQSPTPEMLNKAHGEAEYRTFQAKLGELGQRALHLRNWDVKGVKPLAYVAPFMTTPVNLLKYGTERSVLKGFQMIKRGALGEYKGEKREVLENDAAKFTIGLIIAQQIWQAVQNGDITGSGPADEKRRKGMRDVGWQPYSVKIGGRYVPISQFDPGSTSVNMVADFAELWGAATVGERKQLVGMIGKSFANNMTSKTYLSGPMSLMEAIDDPDRFMESWAGRTAGSVIPAVVAGAARATDPYEREARGILDRIRARVPVLRENLMPQRDVRGNRIKAPGSDIFESRTAELGFRLASPSLPTAAKGGEIEHMVAEMGERIPSVRDTITIQGHTIELTPEEYDVYKNLRGKFVDMAFKKLESSRGAPFWEAPDEAKKDLIGRIVSGAGEAARAQVLFGLKRDGRLPAKLAEAAKIEATRKANSFRAAVKGLDRWEPEK